MSMNKISLSCYDLEKYLLPIWEGDTVYNESFMPLRNEDGSLSPISLAYPIEEIYELRSSDLATLYTEGKDYKIENGNIIIPEGSSVEAMDYYTYYPQSGSENVVSKTGGGRLLFIEGGFFHTKQYSVTYRHKGKWQGPIQSFQGNCLPKTMDKLQNKKPIKIGFLGDSIFTGCNASGSQFGGSQAPFMPAWFDMLVDKLKKHYGNDEITTVNRARGGTKSFWGDEMAKERLGDYKPDLAFIGFGMNDRQTTLDEYFTNISNIVRKVREDNPDCEFILTAPMVANREANGFYCQQYLFVKELLKLKGDGIGVMDVTNAHETLLLRKSYRDMTGNNLNHPNDFLCRIYAQTAVACLIK